MTAFKLYKKSMSRAKVMPACTKKIYYYVQLVLSVSRATYILIKIFVCTCYILRAHLHMNKNFVCNCYLVRALLHSTETICACSACTFTQYRNDMCACCAEQMLLPGGLYQKIMFNLYLSGADSAAQLTYE